MRALLKRLAVAEPLPRSLVPSITTPAYLAYCQALYAGNYQAAKSHVERNLADLNT